MTQHHIPAHRIQTTDNLDELLRIFPKVIREIIEVHPQKDNLIEVVMDLGRLPEARFRDEVCYLGQEPISKEDLQYSIERVGMFGGDNRAGIERT